MRPWLCLFATAVMSFWSLSAAARDVTVGFAGSSAPFVLPDRDDPGIAVEIAREALQRVGHELKPAFWSHKRIREEVKRGRLDAASAFSHWGDVDGLHYSDGFIVFNDIAIVKKRDDFNIRGIGDLPGYRIVAWQNAHDHLGAEFRQLFGPDVREDYVRKYFELADQAAQVRMFWSGRADVILIDDVIFDHLTSTMADSFDTGIPLVRHRIFGGPKNEPIAFSDPELRDQFNDGLARLRAEGGIERIYQKYRTVGIGRTAAIQ